MSLLKLFGNKEKAPPTSAPQDSSKKRSWFRRHPIITILLTLFIIGLIGSSIDETPPSTEMVNDTAVVTGEKQNTNQVAEKPVDPTIEMRKHPERFIEARMVKSYRGGFGAVGIHDVQLTNKASIAYKDIELSFVYLAKSGTTLDEKEYVVYDVLKSGEKKTIREVNVGFLNSADQISQAGVGVKNARLTE